ncbi:MAG: deoxyribose-phosphate aldolase [Candidatus Delongbacteria bacterium]|jgi:deoxyribose-phosphate aldolase|nr:deoxyribose-phosphate aldolase [Candidatus Delongbacteria bacterium]
MQLNLYLEHTILKQGLKKDNIEESVKLCLENNLPTLVVPPSLVNLTSEIIFTNALSLCTVIGFPLGYNSFSVKLYEIQDAIYNGANEIDLVIDNSLVKSGNWKQLNLEFAAYRKACGSRILKVIIETSLLSIQEIINITTLLIENGIDFVKTSTGFVGEGAKLEHITLIKETFKDQIKIKASGGIRDRETVDKFIAAGADRIGTSSTLKILS